MIEYRFLHPSEYPLAAELIGDTFEPSDGLLAAAIEDGNVVGIAALQWIPNVAMSIAEDYRGKVNWREFQRMAEAILDHERKGAYYVFPSDERVAKLCERGGMTKLDQPVFRKEL